MRTANSDDILWLEDNIERLQLILDTINLIKIDRRGERLIREFFDQDPCFNHFQSNMRHAENHVRTCRDLAIIRLHDRRRKGPVAVQRQEPEEGQPNYD